MAVSLITTIKRFQGLSTDTKPSPVPVGSEFWETDTNIVWVTTDTGTTWVPREIRSIILPTTIDLQQVAGDYDLFTATGGSVYVESFTLTLPAVDCSDDVNLTSISVQTDTATVVTLLSAAAGAKANLTASASFAYSTPFALPVGNKIQLTIAGGAADAATVCTVSVRYQAVVPAGYLAP